MSKCYIIAGGDFDGFCDDVDSSDLVIAADKGYEYALDYGIEVDYVIGDFDSTNRPELDNVVKLNPIKDYTDTKAAIMIAIDKGYEQIVVYGGLGGRESHTIANIKMMLEFKKQGIDVSLKTCQKQIQIVDNQIDYKYEKDHQNFYVSVFALSELAKGVCIKGLFYELNDYDMAMDDSLGVSNETMNRDFSISVADGYLLVIFESKDN